MLSSMPSKKNLEAEKLSWMKKLHSLGAKKQAKLF